MKKFLLVATVFFAGYLVYVGYHSYSARYASFSELDTTKSNDILAKAFSNHLSNIKVIGQGVVVEVLPDDNSGKRHQRFVVRLASGQTLLIAHNIDIAQRINSLLVRDTVQFSGDYEWNDQGGVIHNTHRDPKGRHAQGWLECKGKRYE